MYYSVFKLCLLCARGPALCLTVHSYGA